jgi:hypothetical protein
MPTTGSVPLATTAREILNSLWMFVWPVAACLVYLQVFNSTIRGGYSPSDKNKVALGITGVLGGISALFFVNAEGGNLWVVIHARPAWGSYFLLVSGVGLAGCARSWIIVRRISRQACDILSTTEPREFPLRGWALASGLWVLSFLVAVLWLWKISRGG